MYLSAFLSESSEADKEDLVIFKNEGEFDHSKEPDVVPHGALTRYASLTSLYWLSTNPRIPRKSKATLGCILSTLKAAVSLLHQCRVNTTLSIVIFNLVFRYISMRLFNRLIADPKSCTQSIGTKLVRRLNRLKVWAIKEGLNMPAEDHLTIIFQVTITLTCMCTSSTFKVDYRHHSAGVKLIWLTSIWLTQSAYMYMYMYMYNYGNVRNTRNEFFCCINFIGRNIFTISKDES